MKCRHIHSYRQTSLITEVHTHDFYHVLGNSFYLWEHTSENHNKKSIGSDLINIKYTNFSVRRLPQNSEKGMTTKFFFKKNTPCPCYSTLKTKSVQNYEHRKGPGRMFRCSPRTDSRPHPHQYLPNRAGSSRVHWGKVSSLGPSPCFTTRMALGHSLSNLIELTWTEMEPPL